MVEEHTVLVGNASTTTSVVLVDTQTPDKPCGDAFRTAVLYEMAAIGNASCSFKLTGETRWISSKCSVKGMIDRKVKDAIEEATRDIPDSIQSYFAFSCNCSGSGYSGSNCDRVLDENGPNGKGCVHGTVVEAGAAPAADSLLPAGTFTCNCNATGYTGDNCEDAINGGAPSSGDGGEVGGDDGDGGGVVLNSNDDAADSQEEEEEEEEEEKENEEEEEEEEEGEGGKNGGEEENGESHVKASRSNLPTILVPVLVAVLAIGCVLIYVGLTKHRSATIAKYNQHTNVGDAANA